MCRCIDHRLPMKSKYRSIHCASLVVIFSSAIIVERVSSLPNRIVRKISPLRSLGITPLDQFHGSNGTSRAAKFLHIFLRQAEIQIRDHHLVQIKDYNFFYKHPSTKTCSSSRTCIQPDTTSIISRMMVQTSVHHVSFFGSEVGVPFMLSAFLHIALDSARKITSDHAASGRARTNAL